MQTTDGNQQDKSMPRDLLQCTIGGTPWVISSASGTERGEVFYGPTDWLGSRDPMTHIRHTHDSSFGLVD
jgi:hypothetical protein